MNTADWIATGIPLVAIGLAAFGTYAGPLGQLIAAKTHNERLGRITAAAGRYAAEISDVLATLPAGADVPALKAKLLAAAVDKLKGEFAESAAAIGATDPKLLGIVQGEFAKLPAKVTASIIGQLVPGTSTLAPALDVAPIKPEATPLPTQAAAAAAAAA